MKININKDNRPCIKVFTFDECQKGHVYSTNPIPNHLSLRMKVDRGMVNLKYGGYIPAMDCQYTEYYPVKSYSLDVEV